MGQNLYSHATIDNSLIKIDMNAYIEQFASFINMSSIVLQPYKNEFIVRQYNKGQVIYYSSDELTHLYYLIDGYILREHYSVNGDVFRVLNKENLLYPILNLFQDKTTNEMCTALTDSIVMAVPIELIEYICRNHDKAFIQLFKYLSENEKQLIEYNMALSAKSAKSRVIKMLIYLCHSIGEDNEEFYEIKQFLTIQMVSDLARISRETTGHIINELKDQGLLSKNQKDWIISKAILN